MAPCPAPHLSVPSCHQYLPPTATNTSARLTALRDAMRAHNIHAYIVPSTDAHMVRCRPHAPCQRPHLLSPPVPSPERVHC